MNDTTQHGGSSNTGAVLMGFALGAVVGAGLGILLAPDSGKRTRERLASTARRFGRDAGEAIEHAREAAVEFGADAKSALKAGQEAFRHDLATRETRSENRLAGGAGGAPDFDSVKRSVEEAVR
ncbi:MAG TPA: YtxH domain-containing protein [Acidobacteriota bacterium]|nr:YtxH domain-containing protein [Acidobacteriota bacterium]